MVLEYFTFRKSKGKATEDAQADGAKSPVMNEEDEQFLEKITSESAAPANPENPTIILDNGSKVKGKDAQVALMAGADQIPLPASPREGGAAGDGDGKSKEQRNYWSYMPTIPRTSVDWAPYIPSLPRGRSDKQKAAADLASAAEVIKAGQEPDLPEDEEKKEQEDLSAVLDQLNISATTKRTFSLSKESQKLMEDFTQILKDVVNGVPTAYDDLEKFITGREKEISHMFKNLPPWLQTLVKSLPAKMSTTLAPELMAAASEKPGADGKARMNLDPNVKVGSSEPSVPFQRKKKAKKSRIPTLKSLIAQDGAVAGMLRSILNFLKLRFPAFISGTNILLSVAVFLLLFVFWYCHKRGRETRLESERLAASQASLDEEGDGELSAEATDVEDSTVLEKDDNDEEVDAKSTASVQGTPPVLAQPDPKEVPLPDDKV
ncbi:hypothetical protein NA57DRAFT_57731 [Rhizodiscina lignyota]|uniref:Uncharacterized protein n=1 Tax=Rhizodiscina lignyota TaxID=1504668 RepID=A0A9P4IDQ1_9PEZI|nr:hypothetical protein NA57DRAFT_57731 [Rhizodiscina lignyota]